MSCGITSSWTPTRAFGPRGLAFYVSCHGNDLGRTKTWGYLLRFIKARSLQFRTIKRNSFPWSAKWAWLKNCTTRLGDIFQVKARGQPTIPSFRLFSWRWKGTFHQYPRRALQYHRSSTNSGWLPISMPKVLSPFRFWYRKERKSLWRIRQSSKWNHTWRWHRTNIRIKRPERMG